MSDFDAGLARRPLILGEALAENTSKPFQYKYNNSTKTVASTGVLLRTIYGEATDSSYKSFVQDFELRNCLDIELPNGGFLKKENEEKIEFFLNKHISEASNFSDFVTANEHLDLEGFSTIETLPLFLARRVFFLGGVNVALFERMLGETDLTRQRKGRHERLFLEALPAKASRLPSNAAMLAFSVVTLYHPSINWQFQKYNPEEMIELRELFQASSRKWQFDWDYKEGRMFQNPLIAEQT